MKQNVNFKDIIGIALIVFFAITIFGLQPLEGNNVLYIPYLEKLQNPNLFSKDILFDAFRFHLSLFYEIIIFVSNFLRLSIFNIFYFLSLLTFFAIALFSFMIAQIVFNNKKISYLALLFLMASKYSLAYEAIGLNLQQVTQTTIAIAMALYVIYLFLIKKINLSFFILGLMANIQPIITFQLVLVLTFSQLFKIRDKFEHLINFKNILTQYCFTLIGALPILTWVFILKKQSVLSASWFSYSPEWFEIVKLRISHHFLPSRWGFTCWLLGFIFFCIFLTSIIWKNKKHNLGGKDGIIIKMMYGFIPIFILGSVGEVVPIPLILLVEIFRVFVFFNFFCVLYGSYLVYELIKSDQLLKQLVGIILGFYLFLPTTVVYNLYISKPVFLGPLIVLLIFVCLIIINNRHKINKKSIQQIGLAVLLIFLLVSSIRRLYLNYKYWGYLSLDNSQDKLWQETQKWAKNNTPQDALFIVPPNIYGFRIYSQRSIVGTFKDGASMLFHPTLYHDWGQRMLDLGVTKEMVKGAYLFNYKEIRDLDYIDALTKKYQANYLVSSWPDLKLTKAYSNEKYSIYKLK